MKQYLTAKGKRLLKNALNGGSTLHFTKIKLGNGTSDDLNRALAENDEESIISIANSAEELLNEMVSLSVQIDEQTENYEQCIVLKSEEYNNSDLEAGFKITEIGVFVQDPDDSEKDILYSVGYAPESAADYIADKNSESFTATIRQIVYIGDTANITAAFSAASEYVPWNEFEKHVYDYNNPHRTTAAQVGLGNVPNVTTNDQTPTFSEATSLSMIQSGEKFSILLGKIQKAIASLISHISDRSNNPHRVTAAQTGAAKTDHKHSAAEVISGTLKTARGGTGSSTHPKGSVLTGNNDGPLGNISGVGALFSQSTGQPEFGVLPITLGGTGLTQGAQFAADQSSYGCKGSVVLPGGLLVQWGRLKRDSKNNDVTVNFQKPFRDTNYALIFTTADRDYDETAYGLPNWRQPQKETEYFTMLLWKAGYASSAYSDWLAIGMAPEEVS